VVAFSAASEIRATEQSLKILTEQQRKFNMEKVAFVIGGSGSVGAKLINELVQSGAFVQIISFGRKAQGLHGVTEVVISMTPEDLEKAVIANAKNVNAEIIGFSTLGVGAKTASLSFAEHCAVDVDLNRAFAAGLKKSTKSKHLNLMTAVGANPLASSSGNGAAGFSRYNRVKGETEEAAKKAGPEIVSIFRPAMIIGSSHTPYVLEKIVPLFSFITPKNMRSIRTSEIAKSMLACALYPPPTSAIYHYPEMMDWIKHRP
jgi:uncharacterized protein YbjT (DUF2867 family)